MFYESRDATLAFRGSRDTRFMFHAESRDTRYAFRETVISRLENTSLVSQEAIENC